MSHPKKQNPAQLEKSVKLSPVVVLDDIVKDKSIEQSLLPKPRGKGKSIVKQNPIFKEENVGEKRKLVKRNLIFKKKNVGKEKTVKQNPIFKQQNEKKEHQVHEEKAIEISQNTVKTQRIDISSRDSQNTVHSTQKDFSVSIKLRKEFENENGLIEYTCQMCLEKHYSKESFTRHWYLHTVYDPRELCVVCGQKIQKGRKFRNHVVLKHPKHPYKCSECSLVFKGPVEDKCHRLAHVQTCNYFCSICGIGFEVFQVLEFHMFTAHVDGCKSTYSIDQDLLNTFFVKMELT